MIEVEFKITSIFKEDEEGKEYIFDLSHLILDTYQKTYGLLRPNDKLTITFHIEHS